MNGQTFPSPDEESSRTKQYLGEMFRMNPVWESQIILEHRRNSLQLATIGTDNDYLDYDRQQRLRQQGRQQLKKIQDHFFQMPPDKLGADLDSLSSSKHPELASTVLRLSTAAPHRESINAMLDDPRLDRDLVIAFGRALTLAPADAGFAKEQYLQLISRGRNHAKASETIRQIEQRDPALIDLEREWFTTIRNHRRPWFSDIHPGVWVASGCFIAGMIVRFIAYAIQT